ncbi:hypothetical protein CSOJ01_14761 [Colletotrichum sojae]|uniref:F-box domain-containing protein n=1 Tax=Colletotrichum sojae TaxID=2175907 RepID=A0A8H6IP48_9PEZI|nr:hypothetical protein CSOJ01_14761 [Colletotrichum sojae]
MPTLRPCRVLRRLASSFLIVIALHHRLIQLLHVAQRCLTFAYRNLPSTRPMLAPEENMPSDTGKEANDSSSESPEGTQAESLILSLPDEVLLNIMKMAPLDDLFMLRQVSFTFWRLYGDESFKELHRFLDWHGRDRRSIDGFENDTIAVSRAKKNAFCERCLAQRRSPGFLAEGRLGLILTSGRCVGWEGWFRVCSHEWVSMPEMWTYVQRNGGKNSLLSQFPKPLIPPACSACKSVALSSAPGTARAREHIEAPCVTLELETFNPHRSPQRVEFKLSWTLPIFKVPRDQQVSVGLIQRHLAAFVAAYGPGMFCPHVKVDSGFFLRPFDPRYCVCLGGDARLGGITPWDDRLNSQRDSGVWVTFCKSSAQGIPRASERAGKRQRQQPREQEKEEQHAFLRPYLMVHGIGCRSCCAQYSWSKIDDQVFLSRRWSGQLYEPGMKDRRDDRWVKAMIDPTSQGGMPDHSTKHYFWYDDTACRNGRSPDDPKAPSKLLDKFVTKRPAINDAWRYLSSADTAVSGPQVFVCFETLSVGSSVDVGGP